MRRPGLRTPGAITKLSTMHDAARRIGFPSRDLAGYVLSVDLTLAEQVLLIGLDDEHGRDTTQWGSDAG